MLLRLAAFALLGASVIALPAFAPKVEAAEAAVRAATACKSTPNSNCGGQGWLNFEAACLRTTGDGARILGARLVTTRR